VVEVVAAHKVLVLLAPHLPPGSILEMVAREAEEEMVRAKSGAEFDQMN
jgi:hypothetical protein